MGLESLQREAVRTRRLREKVTPQSYARLSAAFRNEYACISRKLSINIQFRIDRVNGSDSLIGKISRSIRKILTALSRTYAFSATCAMECRASTRVWYSRAAQQFMDHAHNLAIEYLNTISF